jgi:FkbM family methyltransferase
VTTHADAFALHWQAALARPAWHLPEDFQTRLVIFGAGGLGRRIARILSSMGHSPLAFCDNNSRMWNTEIEGIKVLSVNDAIAAFPAAVFMIAIWHPSRTEGLKRRAATLRQLGCKEVTCFIPLFWKYPESFLPNMFWEDPRGLAGRESAAQSGRDLLDKAGQEEFDRQLYFHLSGDASVLLDPAPGCQYFPGDLIQLSDDEVFVDCGAYDGDSIRDFCDVSGGRFRRILAFEPDPENFRRLQSSVNDTRVVTRCSAVGAERAVLHMSSSGASSSFSDTGDVEIECATLDELLADEEPTFIKMDIEGAEIDALRGAAETLRRCRPTLAICVYHAPDHLWRIPLLLNELLPGSRLSLRSHMLDGFDTVCYCIAK